MQLMLHSETDRAFLATVLEAPDDDAPRLIYADWLDEQGESDRAEFIRLQVREARMDPDDPERPGVHARAEYLGRIHHVEWANRLPQFEGVHWEVFHRGFFIAGRFDHPDQFFDHAEEVFAANPVQELRLHQFTNTDAPRLANSRLLRSVRTLDLNDGNKLGNSGTEALMESKHLGKLLDLRLVLNGLGPSGMRAIAMSSYARSLRVLLLARNEGYDDGPRFIAESRALVHLDQLDLERTGMTDDGVVALSRSKQIKGLRYLNLSNNAISDVGLKAIAESGAAVTLRALFLSGNDVSDGGAEAIAASARLGGLEHLFLRHNRIGEAGALALASSPHLARLKELHLGDNRITGAAGEQLRSRFRSRVNLF
jgi:uncharacterized protein (TIGR02996 family)